MSEITEYEKLRLDVLVKLIEERDIPYKKNKDDIIRLLTLDDNEKYIRETTYEKDGKGFLIGIDVKNHKQLVEIGKLIEKKDARCINQYSNNRVFYWSSQKLVS